MNALRLTPSHLTSVIRSTCASLSLLTVAPSFALPLSEGEDVHTATQAQTHEPAQARAVEEAPASAAEAPASAAEPPASAALGFRVAVGVSAGVNGSFIQKPKSEYYHVGNLRIDTPYPGFGGVGGVAGAQLDLGWRFITLSTGYTESFDQAEGKTDGFTVTLKQRTSHVPLTLRFELPSKIASPSIFGGVDWVTPSKGELESSGPVYLQGVKSEPYRAWTFGLGVDVMLTETLRLPIRMYGVLNPAPKDTLNDALIGDPQLGKPTVKGEWDWQAGVTLGVSYDVYRR